MGYLSIELDQLSGAERRDLPNALLRAAWSAVLPETRIALLDLIVELDDTILGRTPMTARKRAGQRRS